MNPNKEGNLLRRLIHYRYSSKWRDFHVWIIAVLALVDG
jgi:hypothetical protein